MRQRKTCGNAQPLQRAAKPDTNQKQQGLGRAKQIQESALRSRTFFVSHIAFSALSLGPKWYRHRFPFPQVSAACGNGVSRAKQIPETLRFCHALANLNAMNLLFGKRWWS